MSVQDDTGVLSGIYQDQEIDFPLPTSNRTLRAEVSRTLTGYFKQLDGQPVTDLYDLVLKEVEEPLLRAVMKRAENNQSKASIMLGMNRGTLRKKLKQYGML